MEPEISGRSFRVIRRRLLRRVPTQVKLIWDKTRPVVPASWVELSNSIPPAWSEEGRLIGTLAFNQTDSYWILEIITEN